ncbi:cuticular protein 47Eg-like [Penaeus monodon]|uniref:cuticular protein 47Eg-like n=1 Tax=Penaeus monodon TaxID=6687 RepID=UPI0018A7A5BC|nr:cuticular protein 47Eg-like [Penaeus monodon]XP_037781212.1 cuticular protein 47Eg-like [Penaeus monodon]XP_037781213.1 cuticular protein 47Eg-like [Penaeus monodon]
MKFALALLALVAVAAARPGSVLDLDFDDFHIDQDITNRVMQGTYSWTSPEGDKFFIKYIADKNGYRIVESNAVPVTNGVAADGNQGSFDSFEDLFHSFEDRSASFEDRSASFEHRFGRK